MDSFYVSVERLRDPSLRDQPVVVGGRGPRSVVSSSSYEARKFGVRSAMPMAQARRLCPNIVIVEPNFSLYSESSQKIFGGLEKIAPVVEQVSVDEAYLDFTGCERLYPSHEWIAHKIREVVKEVSGLTASVGIATNKLVAKIASDSCKPDGVRIVPPGSEEIFLAPLSIRKIPGMGPKTTIIFEQRGILTCKDLAAFDSQFLKTHVGDYALDLQRSAKGISDSPVDPSGERKSLSAEETFDVDIGDTDELSKMIRSMADDIATSLREEGIKTRTVQIKIRYSDFTTLVRAQTLDRPTYLSREIFETACRLLLKNKDHRLKLRLLGVSVRNFVLAAGSIDQMNLFEDIERKQKEEKLEFVKDRLKRKFGKKILGASS